VGNIYDSFRFGVVRDFLHFDLGFAPFHPWPAFNIADASICVGVAVLALCLFLRPARAGDRPEVAAPGGASDDLARDGG
jgi:signal peptidase II